MERIRTHALTAIDAWGRQRNLECAISEILSTLIYWHQLNVWSVTSVANRKVPNRAVQMRTFVGLLSL